MSLRFSTEKCKVVRTSVCTMTSRSTLWNFTTWAIITLIILLLNESGVLTNLQRINKWYSEMWQCDVKLKVQFLYSGGLQFVSWPQHLRLCRKFQVLAIVINNLKVWWDGTSRCWTWQTTQYHILQDRNFRFLQFPSVSLGKYWGNTLNRQILNPFCPTGYSKTRCTFKVVQLKQLKRST
jgi:hypothetical protein